jgi:hypothetical protein
VRAVPGSARHAGSWRSDLLAWSKSLPCECGVDRNPFIALPHRPTAILALRSLRVKVKRSLSTS